MGEKAYLPKENGVLNGDNENSDQEMLNDNDESSEIEDLSPEEFQMLDNQLDALNSALDDMEQKNDNIHAELKLLLQSNREIRKQLQEETKVNDGEGERQPPPAPEPSQS